MLIIYGYNILYRGLQLNYTFNKNARVQQMMQEGSKTFYKAITVTLIITINEFRRVKRKLEQMYFKVKIIKRVFYSLPEGIHIMIGKLMLRIVINIIVLHRFLCHEKFEAFQSQINLL